MRFRAEISGPLCFVIPAYVAPILFNSDAANPHPVAHHDVHCSWSTVARIAAATPELLPRCGHYNTSAGRACVACAPGPTN